MGTLVAAQVEARHGGGGQRAGPVCDVGVLPGQGEDGAVVVRVAVEVAQGRPGRGGQRGDHLEGAALADVDHALDDHGRITAWVSSRMGSAWHVGDRRRFPHEPAAQSCGGGALPGRPAPLLGDDGV